MISEESWLNYFYDLYEEIKAMEEAKRKEESQMNEEQDEEIDEKETSKGGNELKNHQGNGKTRMNGEMEAESEGFRANGEISGNKREETIVEKKVKSKWEMRKKEKSQKELKENPGETQQLGEDSEENNGKSWKVPPGIQVSKAPNGNNPEGNGQGNFGQMSFSFRAPIFEEEIVITRSDDQSHKENNQRDKEGSETSKENQRMEGLNEFWDKTADENRPDDEEHEEASNEAPLDLNRASSSSKVQGNSGEMELLKEEDDENGDLVSKNNSLLPEMVKLETFHSKLRLHLENLL